VRDGFWRVRGSKRGRTCSYSTRRVWSPGF